MSCSETRREVCLLAVLTLPKGALNGVGDPRLTSKIAWDSIAQAMAGNVADREWQKGPLPVLLLQNGTRSPRGKHTTTFCVKADYDGSEGTPNRARSSSVPEGEKVGSCEMHDQRHAHRRKYVLAVVTGRRLGTIPAGGRQR